jgi:hypothetical protein
VGAVLLSVSALNCYPYSLSRQASIQKRLDSGAWMIRVVVAMTQSDLTTRITLAQHSRHKSTQGLIACRGELEGQTGVIVYSFQNAATAAAFQMRRQIEAQPLRLEILDRIPTEVREYVE